MSVFYSAWVSETATTWNTSYKRQDLDIASLNCTQSENNCATLSVVVRNVQLGLLAPGRLVWLWLAWQDDAGVTTPIFHGRLVPVPTQLTNQGNATTLNFLARPLDFDTQRVAAALALQTAPNYDPVFIDPTKRLVPTFRPSTGSIGSIIDEIGGQRPPPSTGDEITGYTGDPDTTLEGWARLWSIDRVTGHVDSSDILEGEDGTEIFNADEIPADSVQISVGSSVLTDITVVGTVNWTQSDDSSFGVSISADATNGLDIIQGWPKAGASVAGGYEVKSAQTIDWMSLGSATVQQKGFRYENKAKKHNPGDVISVNWNYSVFPPNLNGLSYLVKETVSGAQGPGDWSNVGIEPFPGADDPNIPFHFNASILVIADVPISASMQLGASSKLGRTETLTLKLAADIQPLIVLPTSAQTPSAASPVSISGSDVGVPIDGQTPISSSSASNYFPSSRGQQSIDYLLAVGIAHLKSANRAISITWATTFERAIALSCRKSATINCKDVPGGTATGKIISYGFSASGPNLQLIGTVTIGCCIGHGGLGTVVPVASCASYAVIGLFVPGVQTDPCGTRVAGSVNTGGGGDTSVPNIHYTPQPGEPIFPLSRHQMVVSEFFSTEYTTVNLGQTDDGQQVGVQVPIAVYNLELLNLSGSFDSVYDLTGTPLKLPKQIDLTVPSW